MTDWCSKISLFSWLSGDSTGRENNQPSTNNNPDNNNTSKPRKKDEPFRQAKQTERPRHPQRHEESSSRASNKYVKNDNAVYFHKASGTNFDARVVGVHFDDDPENPYYTIQYTSSDGEQMERQTTEDRLLPVD